MDVITSLHNPLNCLRCNSAMQNPIRLPCQHHFCRDCVGSTECISCLKPFNVDELVIDKVLNYIVESSREPTETCANCDKISQPMFFCETCQQPLCGECRENTHRAKIFLLHNIVQMEERGRIRNRPFCSTHNEPYILYCLDAKSLMCIECFNSSSLERRGHFLNIDVAHKICCDKLEKSAFNLKTFQSELREQCDLRRRLIDELEKNFDFMSKEVNNKCDDIIVRINQLRSLLLDKLLKEKSGKMDKIISQLKNFDQLESPLAINLLSVSIFCSYASKIDLLHCYGDLSKLIQQFLSSNGQLLQKVKFDSTLNIDFAKEFNLMICQPMGFITSLNENCLMPNKLIVNSGNSKIKNDKVSSSEVKLPNAFDFGFGSDVLISSELASVESTNFNIFPVHSESDTFIEQRFLDLFQNIAIPLQKFTKEISFISSNLIDLHKDIVLRRCVVNGEGLINRLLCCENAWDQLEAHKNKVQMIIQQSLSQLWRQDLERVQRQQQLVREKLEEMQHLQKLAKQALKFSQHFKPFAVQMAGIISVIDVRRTTLAVLSPMEQICSEISNIGPDSESRVAAINKEEKSRLEKIANTLANQAIDYDAMQALKSLKVIPSTSKHPPHRKNPIFEVDRNRPDTSDFCKDSILNSPSVIKKRHQILNRVQRESKVSSNLKIEVENSNNQDATTSEKNPNDARTVEVDQVLNKETIISSDAREDEVKNENSEEFASKIDDSSLLDSSKNKPNITFGLQNRDPAVLIARETLLNSIKEKVKRID